MSSLKPCPFCGGEAELCYGPGLGTDSCRGYTLYASCNECGAKSPGLWQEKKPEPSDPTWKDTADEWNCRPGEIDATKCGVGYCEHYPDGLFVCAKCREESTIAHDKACAKIAEARADADHWKGECNALQRMVHEARAEIERKDKLIEQMRELLQLKNAILGHCRFVTYPPKKIIEKLEKIEAALAAAERGE